MAKKKYLILVCVLLVFAVSACSFSFSSYSGMGIVQNSTSNSWSISWYKLNGTMSKSMNLNLDQYDHLNYAFSCNADELGIFVVQKDRRVELPFGDDSFSFEGFENGRIQIVITVKNSADSSFYFELAD